MSDPKYPEYSGVVRFDDDNIVEVGLEPDTENITVKLNGTEVSGGGSGLPEVDSSDNGDVLTVVEGAWTNAAPSSQLPAVTASDNGNVLTVVEGAWAKAAPAGGGGAFVVHASIEYDDLQGEYSVSVEESAEDILQAYESGSVVMAYIDTETVNDLDTILYAAVIDSNPADEYIRFKGITINYDTTQSGTTLTIIVNDLSYYGSGEPGVPGSWGFNRSRSNVSGS